MTAKYLLRFDDICPTQNWSVWTQVESILNRHNVKPILAVVPDNRDAALMIDPPHPDFWSRVREWQARGWTIALHGYQHAYTTRESGIVGLNAYSEFAGLPYADQKRKIETALGILAQERIVPQAWIAPAHAFDQTTVAILLENGLQTISDGFYYRPVQKMGATWIPQQLWQFRHLPFGLWTVCYHANKFSEESVRKLDKDLLKFRGMLVSLPEVLDSYRLHPETMLDTTFSKFWLWTLKRRTSR